MHYMMCLKFEIVILKVTFSDRQIWIGRVLLCGS